jgi:preprotein translocase subunit SecE
VKRESSRSGSRTRGSQAAKSRSRTVERPRKRQSRSGVRRRKENAIVRYFRQTWAELHKVHWPTRQEASNLTLIVLAVTVAMSAFLGIVDWLSALFFSLLVDITG